MGHGAFAPIMKLFTLPNGLRVIIRQTPDNPVSAAHLFLVEGAATETERERGVTTLMWALLLKGTKRRSAREIAEDLEGLGAHLSGGASHDNSQASCHAVVDYFPQALDIFAETLIEPAHLPGEVEKEKIAHMAAIQAKKESIHAVAQDILNKRLFGDHPYGTPALGLEKPVSELTPAAVSARHKRVMVPNGAILSIASPLSAGRLMPLIRQLFGPKRWPKAKTKPAALKKTSAKITTQALLEKHPFEQAYLMIGFPSIPISSKDYVPLKLLASLLGGGMSSRLFQSLREERGLAYDVGTFLPGRKSGSAFVVYMGLQPAKREEAKREILKELKRIQTEKIPIDELNGVKNYFKGSFILDHQTNSQLSYYVAWGLNAGKGMHYEKNFLKQIDQATPASLQRAARATFSKPSITVEIVPK